VAQERVPKVSPGERGADTTLGAVGAGVPYPAHHAAHPKKSCGGWRRQHDPCRVRRDALNGGCQVCADRLVLRHSLSSWGGKLLWLYLYWASWFLLNPQWARCGEMKHIDWSAHARSMSVNFELYKMPRELCGVFGMAVCGIGNVLYDGFEGTQIDLIGSIGAFRSWAPSGSSGPYGHSLFGCGDGELLGNDKWGVVLKTDKHDLHSLSFGVLELIGMINRHSAHLNDKLRPYRPCGMVHFASEVIYATDGPSYDIRYIEFSKGIARHTSHAKKYVSHPINLAYGQLPAVGINRLAIGGDGNVYRSAYDDDGGRVNIYRTPAKQRNYGKTPRFIRFRDSDVGGFLASSDDPQGGVVFDVEAEDIDVSFDGKKWLHLSGRVCRDDLPAWKRDK